MKKVLICLTVLVVSGGLAWFVYRKFDSTTAAYIVAVVGVAAAIIPIFLPSEKSRVQIETKGSYSPGIVRGNYRVNQSGKKKEEDGDIREKRER